MALVSCDTMSAMRALLEELSFEDRCDVLGVAPRDSGLCVATAAGPGGAIVPNRVGSQYAPLSLFAPPLASTFRQDELLARKLQQEENDLAAQADAAVATDNKLASSMDGPFVGKRTSRKHAPPPADPLTSPAPARRTAQVRGGTGLPPSSLPRTLPSPRPRCLLLASMRPRPP